jgi:RND family efflux transporter MFP subunit
MALSWARKGFWALLVVLIGGGLSYALLVGKPRPEPEQPAEIVPPAVDVVVANPAVRSLSVETQGTVRPLREIQLLSQVGGRVEFVSPRFAQGGFFAADEPLVKVEDVDYQFVIARAESQVAASRQRVAEEQGRALQAKREWRDLGSEQANALFLRKPQLASAKAALKASEADVAAAQLDLSRTSISVPFNGRISEKYVDIGQFVAPGTAIATVYDTDVVQVRLPLTDRQVALLDLPLNYDNETADAVSGAHVRLRARFANKEWEWQGRLVRTDASIDVDSRVVYAVAEIEKPFARDPDSERPPLSPGLFVSATISGRPLPQVTQVPRSALRSDSSVMIVDSKQRAESRVVQVLQSNSNHAWLQGLKQGEQVIVNEPTLILAGMKVSVNVAELASGAF